MVSKDGKYRLIDSGPLPEAVAASAAIPFVFEPVEIPGQASKPLCFLPRTVSHGRQLACAAHMRFSQPTPLSPWSSSHMGTLAREHRIEGSALGGMQSVCSFRQEPQPFKLQAAGALHKQRWNQ